MTPWNKGVTGYRAHGAGFSHGAVPWNKGMVGYMAGEKNPAWKGGVTFETRLLRKSDAYKKWRRAVFVRDDFTCQRCSQRGGRLHADHVRAWADFPEGRMAVENGVTLCRPCHFEKTYSRPMMPGSRWATGPAQPSVAGADIS